jgi:hypothetical protein
MKDNFGSNRLFTRAPACGNTHDFVIPRHAARRGIALFLSFNPREIPRFAQNDKTEAFFRKP